MCAEVTGTAVTGPTPLYCDNRAAELWTRNPQHFARQQHIDRCDLSVREQVLEFKNVTVHLVPTQLQLADCFTKSLPLPAFRPNIKELMDELSTVKMAACATNEFSSNHLLNNADDAQLSNTKLSPHSHGEQECLMALETGPSLHYGGMLNYVHSEFTKRNNLSNKLNADYFNSAIAAVSLF